MRAIFLQNGSYRLKDCEAPKAAAGEVLIKTAYAGINRADLLQKQGKYPLPTAKNPIPGMEVSGEILECGAGVTEWKVGDKVCALMREGAFAEIARVNSAHILPVPPSVSLEAASAMPEACFTVWISLVWQANLKRGETVLIHGGTSGIGTIGIQIAKLLGAHVFTTCGSPEKCQLAEKLGAKKAIHYRKEDFAAVIKEATGGKGADVILDMVGGDYIERNLDCLAHGGRLAIIAFQKGAKVNVNMGPVLLKHLQITGSTLRSRPAEEKARLATEIKQHVWKAVADGAVKPVIDQSFPLEEAEKALHRMDQGLNIGKILLKI